MRNVFIISAILFCVPSLSFADASDYKEEIYTFRSALSDQVANPQECIDIGWLEFNENDPVVALFDIYSFDTKDWNGKVRSAEHDQPIGYILTCADWSGFTTATAFDPIPSRFKAVIDGVELIFEGEGRYISFDIPEFPVGLGTYVLSYVNDPSRKRILGGQLITNTITSLEGSSPPGYTSGSLATIRLYKIPPDVE